MKRSIILLSVVALVAACALPASAAGEDGITMSQSIKREVETVNDKGEKVTILEDVETAVPGEELVIVITYVNDGKIPAANISINNPLSEGLRYLAGSAEGADTVATFSVDNGNSFDRPENLFVTDKNGDRVPAVAADYTNILWKRTAPLAPGQKGAASFKAVVK